MLLVVLFLWPASGWAGEVRFYENSSPVPVQRWNTTVGHGQAVIWRHNISADVLVQATRAGIILEGSDVDYPQCCVNPTATCPSDTNPLRTDDSCEKDQLLVNGSDIGLLEGANNVTRTVEMSIPISALQAGDNTFTVNPDIEDNGWLVSISASSIYLYKFAPAPYQDIDLQVLPELTLEPGETREIPVDGRFLGSCAGPIDLSLTRVPAPLQAKLQRGQVTTSADSTGLTVTAATDAVPGNYTIEVTASGCGAQKKKNVAVTIVAGQLEIRKSQSQATVLPGMRQSYKITVTNNGRAALSGIEISDTLDDRLQYLSDTSGRTPVSSDNTHTWYFNRSLAPAASFSFFIHCKVKDELFGGVSISNQAEGRAAQAPAKVTSNWVTAISSFVPVAPDGLRVTKRLVNRNARIGKVLTYRVTMENTSNGNLFNLRLEDRLPVGFQLVPGRVVQDGRRYDDPDGTRQLSWSLGLLPAGRRTTLSYQVVVGSNAARGRNENTARATAVDGGGNSVSASDSAVVSLGATDLEEPGRIEVRVFDDHNRNRIHDAGDHPIEGIGIFVSGDLRALTDRKGLAQFEALTPGMKAVAVDERTLPDRARLADSATRPVRVMESETVAIDFPVHWQQKITRLEGRVFVDRNANGRYDDGERLPAVFQVNFDQRLVSEGRRGRFVFSGIDPGDFVVRIRWAGKEFSQPVTLQRGPNQHDFPLPYSGIRVEVREGE